MSMDKFLGSIPEEFWQIIEDARQDRARLRARLKQMSREELINFAWTYEGLANELRHDIYRDFLDPDMNDEDDLAHIAYWVVAQGRELYGEVWSDPEKIPQSGKDPGLMSEVIREYNERYDNEGLPVNEREWDYDWRSHGKKSPWE